MISDFPQQIALRLLQHCASIFFTQPQIAFRRKKVFTYILYALAAAFLLFSFIKDRKKTAAALRKAWKSFESILPSILTVLMIIGLILTFLDEEMISRLLGSDSGILGMLIAAAVGSITLIPGFVAFPLAAALLSAGAGYAQIALFISTLMMVGVATMPLEARYFGKATALKRNMLSLAAALISSMILGGLI